MNSKREVLAWKGLSVCDVTGHVVTRKDCSQAAQTVASLARGDAAPGPGHKASWGLPPTSN